MENEVYTYSIWVPGNPLPSFEEFKSNTPEGVFTQNFPLFQAFHTLNQCSEVSAVRWRVGEVEHLLARNPPAVV